MKIIKRYQNRKLYDTEVSTYVTLDDIARMVRNGEDVKVIDNKSKKDLTSVTLAQIIFEEQKKHREVLPLAALKRIIQTGGESIQDFVGKHIDPGITAFQRAQKELEQYIEKMVHLGKLPSEDGKTMLGEYLAQSRKGIDEIQRLVDERVRLVLEKVRGATSLQSEVESLEAKVAELEVRLEEEKAKQAQAKKAPRRTRSSRGKPADI